MRYEDDAKVTIAYDAYRAARRLRTGYAQDHGEVGAKYDSLLRAEERTHAELMRVCERISMLAAFKVSEELAAQEDETPTMLAALLSDQRAMVDHLRWQLTRNDRRMVLLTDATEALALLLSEQAGLREQGAVLGQQVLAAADEEGAVEVARRTREMAVSQGIRLEALNRLTAKVTTALEGQELPEGVMDALRLMAGQSDPANRHRALLLLFEGGYRMVERLGRGDEDVRTFAWALDQLGGHLDPWPGEQPEVPDVAEELRTLRELEQAARTGQALPPLLHRLTVLRAPNIDEPPEAV